MFCICFLSRDPEPRCSMRPTKMPLSGVVSWLSWITNAFQEGSAALMVTGPCLSGFLGFIT